MKDYKPQLKLDLNKIRRNIELFIERKGVPLLYAHDPSLRNVRVGTGKFINGGYYLGEQEIYEYRSEQYIPSNKPELSEAWGCYWRAMQGLRLYPGRPFERFFTRLLLDGSNWREAPAYFKGLIESEPGEDRLNISVQPMLRSFLAITGVKYLERGGITGSKNLKEFFRSLEEELKTIPPPLRNISYTYDYKTKITLNLEP